MRDALTFGQPHWAIRYDGRENYLSPCLVHRTLTSENFADAPRASGVAVTAYEPPWEFAVQIVEACPDVSVKVENVEPPPGKVHEAPVAGAAKSTRMPFSGVPAGEIRVI